MPVNYHTHTFRCGHAENVPDEAYLQRAIEQGFTVLGFSDHTPWQGLSPAVCRGVRMLPEELPGYFASIHALQEKYRGVIEIPLGLECEYFPGHMDYLREIRPQVDYLILGNHFQWADPEHPRAYTAAPMLLEEYLTTTLAGMRTGLYAYLAHPDLIYTSQPVFDETCREAAYTLCEEAKKLDLPLEYNLYGVDNARAASFPGSAIPARHSGRLQRKPACAPSSASTHTNSSTCASGRAMKRRSNIWRVWGFRLCSGCFNLVSNRFSARTCNSGAQLV